MGHLAWAEPAPEPLEHAHLAVTCGDWQGKLASDRALATKPHLACSHGPSLRPFRGIISKFEPSRGPLTVMIADIKFRLFCFSCKLLAFQAEICQMTAGGWPSISKREDCLYTPTCIETVANQATVAASVVPSWLENGFIVITETCTPFTL